MSLVLSPITLTTSLCEEGISIYARIKLFGLSYRSSYYWTHPHLFFKDVWRNLKNMRMRVRRGWCWQDLWNMNDWLLEILPDMLRALADRSVGYPGSPPFDTDEKWRDWLTDLARRFEYCQEDKVFARNKYDKEYHKTSSTPEVRELYFKENERLFAERQRILKQAFNELSENIDQLWD